VVSVPRLILILGDQLSPDLSALDPADKSRDVIVMAEVRPEGTYVPHHAKKIALILAAIATSPMTFAAMAGRSPIHRWTTRTTRTASVANCCVGLRNTAPAP